MAKRAVPADVLSPTALQGLSTTYYTYDGAGRFGNELYSTTSPNIDYNWGSAAPNSFVPRDRFGVKWYGTITAPATGSYVFSTESDDGIRVQINNQTIIDAWNDHPPRRDNGAIILEAGKTYAINVTYFENYGGAVARLFWKTPGQNEVIVPASALRQN
jgi:hypothetical protein